MCEFIDDYEILLNLASYKINKQDLGNDKILRKYINFFKSRGFEESVILKVIKKFQKYD